MKKTLRVCLLSLLSLLTGCLPTFTLEDVQTIQTVGFDYLDPEKIQATASLVIYGTTEEKVTIRDEPVISEAHTFHDFQRKLNIQVPKPTATGKLGTILLSEELARKGVGDLIDTFSRSPEVGRDLYIAIAKSTCKDILTHKYPITTNITEYLKKLFEQNEKLNLPSTNIHEFLNAYYGKGINPTLPIIQRMEDNITLDGLAIFHKGNMTYKIPQEDSFIFKMLYQDFIKGFYELQLEKQQITYDNIRSNVKVKYNLDHKHPEIDIQLRLKAYLNEGHNTPHFFLRDMKKLEEKTQKKLYQQAINMVTEFQKRKLDPIGFGKIASHQDRKWDEVEWQEKIYPHLKFNIHLDFQILEMGTIE